ncbi:MAG: hypothetical protein AB7R77_16120 [Ilumatobacteraceae bacterium]
MAILDLRDLISRTVLVGITYVDGHGTTVDQVQFAGIVRSVDPLVAIDTGDDELFTLPPEPEAFDVAAPGEYRLHTTGEVVVNPDFTTSWTVESGDE